MLLDADLVGHKDKLTCYLMQEEITVEVLMKIND